MFNVKKKSSFLHSKQRNLQTGICRLVFADWYLQTGEKITIVYRVILRLGCWRNDAKKQNKKNAEESQLKKNNV